MGTLVRRIMRPLDERLGLSESLHASVLDRPVPMHARRFWYCFGGLTFFLILLEVLTGVILAFYYVPTPDRAYSSVFYITHYVRYGWLVRSTHFWAAQLIVVFIQAHMLRVFWTASYKNPRELNWVVGVLLWAVTMAFGPTGYLLPWDQKAYWGSTVSSSLISQLPIIGKSVAYLILGGDNLGAPALTRSYTAHIMLLPAILAAFLVAHFWMVRRQGISGPPL